MLRRRIVRIAPELNEVFSLRIKGKTLEHQPDAVHAEHIHALAVLQRRNRACRRDQRKILAIANRIVGGVEVAVGEPRLYPETDFQAKRVLELRIDSPIIAEFDALPEIHRRIGITRRFGWVCLCG